MKSARIGDLLTSHQARLFISSAAKPSRAYVAIGARLGLLPVALIFGLSLILRAWNPLALDPFTDEIDWMHWVVDIFEPGKLDTYLTPLFVDGRPPLHFWILLLTQHVDGNAFIGGRLAAALASSATAVALYVVGAQIFSRSVGLIAAVLWSVLPMGVFFGRIASSDDSLLAVWSTALVGASVALAQCPSIRAGAFCGLFLGLAILSKTTGVLAASIPFIAILIYSRGIPTVRLALVLGIMVLTSIAVLSPVLPWMHLLIQKGSYHADIGMAGAGEDTLTRLLRTDLIGINGKILIDSFVSYLDVPMLMCIAFGATLGVVRRDRRLVFLTLVSALCIGIIVLRTTTMYSRYLVAPSTPLFIVAAYAIWHLGERFSTLLSRGAERGASGQVGYATAGMAFALSLAVMLPGMLRSVEIARGQSPLPIPSIDRLQYAEHWYAMHGLGEVSAYLQRRAQSQPLTVMAPAASTYVWALMPYYALRLSMRDEPIRFVEGPSLEREQSPEHFTEWTVGAREPTYLIVNQAMLDAPLRNRRNPEYQSWLDRAFPDAEVAVSIARFEAPYALTLYRIDKSGAAAAPPSRGK